MLRTPSDDVAADEELLARHEGDDDNRVEVHPFTEHPEKVTRHEVLSDHVKHLTPNLRRILQRSDMRENTCGLLSYDPCF